MESTLKDIQYVLLPGKPGRTFNEIKLYNRVYKFRNDFWSEILLQVFADRRKLTGDDFMRQDVIAVLLKGEDVIGFQAYTFFDLRLTSAREHSYITNYFDDTFLRRLADKDASYVMSIEYFSIHPDWRSANVGLSLGRVLLALGLQVATYHGVDAAIAAARDDVPASAMAAEMGAVQWAKGIRVFGCPTDLVVFFPNAIRPLARSAEHQLAARLWREKRDFLITDQQAPLKNIA